MKYIGFKKKPIFKRRERVYDKDNKIVAYITKKGDILDKHHNVTGHISKDGHIVNKNYELTAHITDEGNILNHNKEHIGLINKISGKIFSKHKNCNLLELLEILESN